MFKTTHLNLRNAGTLNPLVLDYLEKNKQLSPFYEFFPDAHGFSELLTSGPYKEFNREQLVQILMHQSQQVQNTSEQTVLNIQTLKEKNTFTVTTGHQLCLFTGPLFFIYKLISTIKLASDLKKQFPNYNFVPVYWMASEDHDFEEVASFQVNGKTITWKSEQKGAVGGFKTGELKSLLPDLAEALGNSENSKQLLALFENAYLKHSNLGLATRYLVNELFGDLGLICLDANHTAFKQQIKSLFRKDLFENVPHDLVNTSTRALEKLNYSIQVSSRPINCFYLDDQLRARIEKNGNRFDLVGTGRSFTAEELNAIIEKNPERISPNVVLRPVYQQIILPNIAYLGGPGELAYWLEFKEMFNHLQVQFPILMPRNFISIVDKPTQAKITKLQFSTTDFFKPEQELIKDHLVKIHAVFDLDREAEQLSKFYEGITERTSAVDVTLARHVQAARQRAMNQLRTVAAKTGKALKKKAETSIQQITTVKHTLFPNAMPQERHENFSTFYLKYGPSFFKTLEQVIDPFKIDQKILIEE